MALTVQGLADPQVSFKAKLVKGGGRLLNLPEMPQAQAEQAADKDLAHDPVRKEAYGLT